MKKHRPLLANSSSRGALNTKNWTKTEGTTISTGWAAEWTSKQTSQHHLLWLKLSAARFLTIAKSSGWGSTTSSAHDWTLLSIPDTHSYLGRRFPNAFFHIYVPQIPPVASHLDSPAQTALRYSLRARFVSAQQRFWSTCNFKPSELQPAWELHGKSPGTELNKCWKTGKVRNYEGWGEAGTADGFCSKK